MKKTVFIEIEETVTETRIVRPGKIYCPACGSLVSPPRTSPSELRLKPPRTETIFIKPENVKLLDPANE
jgi:hypothetical protein